MFQPNFQSAPVWNLKDIETNFGWRPHCDNQQCQHTSYVRFLLVGNNSRHSNSLCSNCAASYLGINQQKLSICDTYVKSAKPLFLQLKNMDGMIPPRFKSHSDVTGYFNIRIGDERIWITEFKKTYYMLKVNGETIKPNLKYKAFKGRKQVTSFAVETVNNRYKTYLHDYIFKGISFTMP